MTTPLRLEDLPHYTDQDYRQWEGDWELIHGIPYAMAPAPVKRHQMLTLAIGSGLLAEVSDCPDCEVLLETDWVVRPDTVLRPDVALVCRDDNPRHIAKTPELIFEVLGPSTATRDQGLKLREYEAAGVRYYVLIDPDELRAAIHRHDGERFRLISECSTGRFDFAEVYCPVSMDFATLFQRFR